MLEVMEPLLTEEFIIRIYQYLVITKTKELIGWRSEIAEGQCDGYICCLEDLFGTCTDREAECAADEKRTIFHVVDRILATVKPDLGPYVDKSTRNEFDIDVWIQVVDLVKDRVRDYAVEHFDDCLQGIHAL